MLVHWAISDAKNSFGLNSKMREIQATFHSRCETTCGYVQLRVSYKRATSQVRVVQKPRKIFQQQSCWPHLIEVLILGLPIRFIYKLYDMTWLILFDPQLAIATVVQFFFLEANAQHPSWQQETWFCVVLGEQKVSKMIVETWMRNFERGVPAVNSQVHFIVIFHHFSGCYVSLKFYPVFFVFPWNAVTRCIWTPTVAACFCSWLASDFAIGGLDHANVWGSWKKTTFHNMLIGEQTPYTGLMILVFVVFSVERTFNGLKCLESENVEVYL